MFTVHMEYCRRHAPHVLPAAASLAPKETSRCITQRRFMGVVSFRFGPSDPPLEESARPGMRSRRWSVPLTRWTVESYRRSVRLEDRVEVSFLMPQ